MRARSGTARGATLRDVAELAGVSSAAASYALRDMRGSGETRRRVRAAADRIGYRADPVARALRGGSTGLVGMIGGNLGDYWHQELASRVGLLLQEADRHMLLSDAGGDGAAQVALARALVAQRVDGLIVLPVAPAARGWAEIVRAVPTVAVGARLPAPAGEIRFATERGVALVVDELEALGHRRVLALTSGRPALPRRAGVEVVRCGFTSSEALAVAAAALRAPAAERPTAVFALSDAIAFGVYGACRELGLAIPGDVSVVGFDDLPLARLLDPPLSAVGWDTPRVARAASSMLDAAMAGEERGGVVVMPPRLERRASAGPPP
jgi:LacI family transcriptional regulator